MNNLNFDNLNNIFLFLDERDLANLSAVNRKMHYCLLDAASWPNSGLKPQQATSSKDKISSLFKYFLENLTINQPSRFLASSLNGGVQFEIEVFCSNGGPILETRNFAPNWSAPNEPEPADSGSSRNLHNPCIYSPQELPEIQIAWGESYKMGLWGPSNFTNITADANFLDLAEQALAARIACLKSNEESSFVERFQSLPPEEQEQYAPMSLDALDHHLTAGIQLAERRNRSARSSCYEAAIKVAVVVTAIGIAIGFHFLGNPFER